MRKVDGDAGACYWHSVSMCPLKAMFSGLLCEKCRRTIDRRRIEQAKESLLKYGNAIHDDDDDVFSCVMRESTICEKCERLTRFSNMYVYDMLQ